MSDAGARLIRRQKTEEALEVAFEDDVDRFEAILASAAKEKAHLIMTPERGEDSFLGEAACGNATEVVKYLLSTHGHDIDINHFGKHNRTALARAVYNDAVDVIPVLLEHGADPRLLLPQEREEPSEEFPEGRLLFREWDPKELGSNCTPGSKKILTAWDIQRTIRVLATIEQSRAKSQPAHEEQISEESIQALAQELQEARQARKVAIQKEEKRIKEYDLSRAVDGKTAEELAVLEGLIKEARIEAERATVRVTELEPIVREKNRISFSQSSSKLDEVASVSLDDLATFLIEDPARVFLESSRNALLVDPSNRAASLLTYRNLSSLSLSSARDMKPLYLRLALLGAIRFGKPLLFDAGDRTLPETIETIEEAFNHVQDGLYALVENRTIRQRKLFASLITEEVLKVDDELLEAKFSPLLSDRFFIAIITTEPPIAFPKHRSSLSVVLVK